MAALQRLGRALYRELWQRSLPHGLMSWRYLMPGLLPEKARQIRIHRQLWWQGRPGRPRPLWLLVEFERWLRWVAFSGWRAAWKVWRRAGKDIRTRDGISLWRQARTLVALAIGRCIPPRDVYRFRLHLAPERAWDYVYDHEAPAYHRWRSAPLGDGGPARALLADKLRLGEALAAAGVPMVPTLACVPRGEYKELSSWLDHGTRLFCKRRRGNRGLGAFTAWRRGNTIAGRAFDGTDLQDATAVDRAWRALLKMDDALVQPCLANHPALAPLAAADDVITVRYISLRQGNDYTCLSATLEVPAGRDEKSGKPIYTILPLAPGDGEIRPWPGDLGMNPEVARRYAYVRERLANGQAIPDWETLAGASLRAHALCPELWAIAWDWVVTPEGARLLEGNSGWGTAMPQILQGGLLRAGAP